MKWVSRCKYINICRRFSDCLLPGPVDPNTQITTLRNGLRLATETINSPLACISMFIEAGPRFETSCNNGITHVIEHMAYKGFKAMKQSDLEATVSFMGGQLSVNTSKELQIFTAKCLAEYATDVVDIFSRIVLDMSIYETNIEEVKQEISLETIEKDNDSEVVIFDYLHQTAFQGTPLAQRVIGPSYIVDNLDACFISSFIQSYYQPYKIVIATAGGVPHEQMLRFVESRFGHMVGDPCYESNKGACRYTGSQITYRDDSMPFAHVAIAVEAPGYCSPDFLTMLVASCMIGSWDKSQGTHSGMPLAQVSSVSQLSERYESFYISYKDIGLWGIYFVSKKMEADDMLLNVQDQWMRLCSMVRDTDVERGKCFARLKLAKTVEGVVNSSIDIGTQVMYTRGRKPITDLFKELEKIDVSAIRNACNKYIYDKCPAVAAVGPTETLSDYVRIRAGMYWLRL